MKSLLYTTALFLLFLLVPLQGSAEIYKYRDSNGNLRFTDDLSQVPPEQRPQVTQYTEIKPAPQKNADLPATPSPVPLPDESKKDPAEFDFKGQVEQFNTTKQGLDAEYRMLLQEKQVLAARKKTRRTNAEINAYNKQAADLNARIAAYEKKRRAFNAEIRQYNRLVEKDLVEKIMQIKTDKPQE